MYKLILVDDEEEVRKGILNKIEWEKYGFQIAGEAENGIEALEIAEKTVPDVVMTDIKMPFMDGLQLAEKVGERFPTATVIILTGFDEFEYAQKAIKLNVVEYILKPIASKELIEVLKKVKAKIDDRISSMRDMEMLKDYYKKSLPILKEKFLGTMIMNKMSRDEIYEKSHAYGINIEGSGFIAALIDIDQGSLMRETDTPNEDLMTADKELARLAVLNMTEGIINKYDFHIVFLHNDSIVIIFLSEIDNKDSLYTRILPILEEIRQSIKTYLKFSVTLGVGTYCRDIADISYSYKGALSALDYSLVLGRNRIIYIEDMEPKCTHEVVFDEMKERMLISSIKAGTSEEIKSTIDKLFTEIFDKKVSFKECQIYLLGMLTSIIRAALDMNIDLDSILGVDNVFVELYKLRDSYELKEWIYGICIKIRGSVLKGRQDSCRQFVKDAIQYIKNNYSDSDLTIEKVCKYLHISSAYFSTIFKKETKLTFLNYLTQVRMDEAKELLRTANLKTFEIAKMVGYSEPCYFSYCFKKNFNISPTEYRNSI